MNRKEIEFIIKKYIKENVFRTAKIEIPNITFLETEYILENASLKNLDLKKDDVLTVVNLYNAWNFIYDNLDRPLTSELIFKLHDIIANHQALEAGVIRSGNVGISGTEYKPPSPYESDLKAMLNSNIEKLNNEYLINPIEASIAYLLDSCRNQYFGDGNKRCAFLVANFVLLKSGNGILGLDDKTLGEFSRLLTDFYETNNKKLIADFLYNNCLKTFDFKPNNTFNIDYFADK